MSEGHAALRLALELIEARSGHHSQRIRTVARLPFEVALLETVAPPIYQQIAQKAVQLSHLGMSLSRTAKVLGVTGKTVAKGIRWARCIRRTQES